LRIVTDSQNAMNKGIRKNNTSGKVGVHWNKQNQKWCAMIGFNHNHINLGYFDNYEDAVNKRLKAEEKYFGKYRPIDERVVKGDY
jgi:hypothetical protein